MLSGCPWCGLWPPSGCRSVHISFVTLYFTFPFSGSEWIMWLIACCSHQENSHTPTAYTQGFSETFICSEQEILFHCEDEWQTHHIVIRAEDFCPEGGHSMNIPCIHYAAHSRMLRGETGLNVQRKTTTKKSHELPQSLEITEQQHQHSFQWEKNEMRKKKKKKLDKLLTCTRTWKSSFISSSCVCHSFFGQM